MQKLKYKRPTSDDLEYEMIVRPNGRHIESWKLNGQLHSIDDAPSCVINDGDELHWHMHGQRHREESYGPALVQGQHGLFKYFNLNRIHRRNGPAIITPVHEKWYHKGKLHRLDGPAITTANKDGTVTHSWGFEGERCNFKRWIEISECDPELYTLLKLQYVGMF